ncbi:MAG: AAA family ATPase, partial [Desulfobacula sp.]|uniref:AAA family ATPase n=1 Tax=Desulfobacula sp. TaxID=2593537 RepID=UPI0025BCD777
MQKLPIGIQTFSDIRTGNYCYADKTGLIAQLTDQGKFYFLSRPRRFGKSLLIDTIAEAFLGNKKLFKGLYLENEWDWSKQHAVIRIDFAQVILQSGQQLESAIMEMLDAAAESFNITLKRQDIHLVFSELIRKLHEKTGQRVAVLVDEYDKPILDNITNPDIAKKQRNGLRNFYSVLKAQGAHLCF